MQLSLGDSRETEKGGLVISEHEPVGKVGWGLKRVSKPTKKVRKIYEIANHEQSKLATVVCHLKAWAD